MSMIKLLHSADWHLDAPLRQFSPEQRKILREKQLALPGMIGDLALREGCDLALLSGDLFDSHAYTPESYRAVYRALERMGIPVFIAPGNHDYYGERSPWFRENWPGNVHIFKKQEISSVPLPELGCRVYGAAFTSMDCPGLLEGFRAECPERYAVMTLHGDPGTAGSPYNPVSAVQVRDSGLDYLALGHIHKAGSFRAGCTLCGWPGCPMGRGWDETGEKGVYLVELEPDSAEIRHLSLNTPRFTEATADISDGAAAALEALLPPVESRDFFRITLKGEGRVSIEELKQAFPHIPNLELRDQTEEPLDIWGDESQDTLEGTFFRLLREKMDAANPQAAARIQMAAEISRRLMEGREVLLP